MKNLLHKVFDVTFLKYNLVGFICTVVGYSVMFLLRNLVNWSSLLAPLAEKGVSVVNMPYWISSAADYIVSGTMSYLINRRYTFHDDRPIRKTAFRYAGCLILSYILAYSVAKPLTLAVLTGASPAHGLSETGKDNVAQLAGVLIFMACNYLLQRFFSFRKAKK